VEKRITDDKERNAIGILQVLETSSPRVAPAPHPCLRAFVSHHVWVSGLNHTPPVAPTVNAGIYGLLCLRALVFFPQGGAPSSLPTRCWHLITCLLCFFTCCGSGSTCLQLEDQAMPSGKEWESEGLCRAWFSSLLKY
jgi:hypothetical protein